jgi:hypothetical protein
VLLINVNREPPRLRKRRIDRAFILRLKAVFEPIATHFQTPNLSPRPIAKGLPGKNCN